MVKHSGEASIHTCGNCAAAQDYVGSKRRVALCVLIETECWTEPQTRCSNSEQHLVKLPSATPDIVCDIDSMQV